MVTPEWKRLYPGCHDVPWNKRVCEASVRVGNYVKGASMLDAS